MNRRNERILLTTFSFVLILFFSRLIFNLNPTFQEAEKGYKDGTILHLSKNIDEETLADVLEEGNYIDNPEELQHTVRNLVLKLDSLGSPENLGALNKSGFQVIIDSSNFSLERLKNENEILGLDSMFYLNSSLNLSNQAGTGGMSINGKVISKENLSTVDQIISKFYGLINKPYGKPLSGTLIRLERYFPELKSDQTEEAIPSIETYAKTDANGDFKFNGLTKGGSYSVIPLKEGFEFGNKKGTTNEEGKLVNDITCNFEAKTHKVKIFDTSTYQQIKEDKVFTVRTPQEYKSKFISWVIVFFISFWFVHLIWSIRKFNGDTLVLPLLMLITGFGTLIMFAIQDPLRDTFRGGQTVAGIVLGLFALLIISQINVVKLLTVPGDLFRNKNLSIRKPEIVTRPGFWLGVSFLLMILLILFGSGPEGSGVKVNLGPFQPSEVTKYLVIIFFAGYFAKNGIYLRQIPNINWRWKNNRGLFVGFAFLLAIYLALGDMGPAMVLCFAFLIMYASIRSELLEMVGGAFVYVLLIIAIANILPETQDKSAYLAVTFLYFLIWIAYGYIKKDFKESAILIVLMFAAFIFGETFHKRLKSRNDIFRDIWNNGVFGGDQVSHGIWSLSSGGWFGQGIGKGYSKVMPANHTDMILPSIGEEVGFLGLLLLIFCIGALLYRSILIARRAGNDFAFYLGSGIAIVTGIQFFLIAFGAIGLVPLTGISVPFLSFGKAALATNIAGLGIILSISCLFSTKTQSDYIRVNYDPIIKIGKRTFQFGFIVLACALSWYQILKPENYIVRPSLVVNRAGQKIYSQNPRIEILARKLEAGNIYDRNNILLATSRKIDLEKNRDSLQIAGADMNHLNTIQQRRLKRFYPFNEQMLFVLGDFNEGISISGAGYGAEFRHLSALRGYDNHPAKDEESESLKFRENSFVPSRKLITPLVKYDYSSLIPILKEGIDTTGSEFKKLKKKNRDIILTFDVRLQAAIQSRISSDARFNKHRTSVVILNPRNGEVLTSANYPLPNKKQINELNKIPKSTYSKTKKEKFGTILFTDRDMGITYPTAPGSTAKIITSFAGLNQLGIERIRREAICKNILANERIRDDDPIGDVGMEKAIIESSNVYFVWLANKYRLDQELFNLYHYTGMGIAGKGHNFFGDDESSLVISRKRNNWQMHFDTTGRCDNEKLRGRLCSSRSGGISGAAWGQGDLQATPLSIGRMAGIIANNGRYRPSKFVQSIGGLIQTYKPSIQVSRQNGISEELGSYMAQHPFISKKGFKLTNMAGKSGTPERNYYKSSRGKNGKEINDLIKTYDGWFVFYADSPKLNSPVVVCIRIEHDKKNGEVGSGKAGDLAKFIIEPLLL